MSGKVENDDYEDFKAFLSLVPGALTLSSAASLVLSVAYQICYYLALGWPGVIGQLTLTDFVNHAAFAVIACLTFIIPTMIIVFRSESGKKKTLVRVLGKLHFRRGMTILGGTTTLGIFILMFFIGFYRTLIIIDIVYLLVFLSCFFYLMDVDIERDTNVTLADYFRLVAFLVALASLGGTVVGLLEGGCLSRVSVTIDKDMPPANGVLIAIIDRGLWLSSGTSNDSTVIPWSKIGSYKVESCKNRWEYLGDLPIKKIFPEYPKNRSAAPPAIKASKLPLKKS